MTDTSCSPPTGMWRDRHSSARVRRRCRLAVIVPTLNERHNIVALVTALDRAIGHLDREIVFVDDWSDDGTHDVIAALAQQRPDIRLIRRYGRRGLSSAVIEGILSTTAPIVAVIDADMQHDETILPALVDAVAGGADIAIGSRYADGGSCGAWNAARASGSRFATVMARLVVPPEVTDPMSGFFVTRQSVVLAAVPFLDGRGFKILLDLLSASPRALQVKEVPFVFRSRTAGESKLGARVVLDYLRVLWKRGVLRQVSRVVGRGGRKPVTVVHARARASDGVEDIECP